jgi:putative ABC transport system ATP-binding protein
MSLLRFEHVNRTFPVNGQGARARTILQEVSFSLAEDEVVALVGRSGAGKTTLLYLAAGLCRPSGGRIQFDGQDLATMSEWDLSLLRRRRIGLVFQNNLSLSALPVWENAAFPLLLAGVSPGKARRRAEEMLERMDLLALADSSTLALSGGQRRRLGIARAMVGEPALLLADEPTADLDEETGARIESLLFNWLVEKKRAALIVTHSPSIERSAGRILLLQDGRVKSDE